MATYHYNMRQLVDDYEVRRTDDDGSNAEVLLHLNDSTGDVEIGNNNLDDTTLTLFDNAVTRKSTSFKSPALAASYTLTLPTDDGTNGQVLATDGAGTLQWSSPIYSVLDFGLNNAFSNDTKELRTTNGSDQNDGYRLTTAGTLTHLSLNADCSVHSSNATMSVEVYKNGTASGITLTSDTVTGTGLFQKVGEITLSVAQDDRITCYTTVPSNITIRKIAVLVLLNS